MTINVVGPLQEWIVGETYLLKGLDKAPAFAVLAELPTLRTFTNPNPRGTFWVIMCYWWLPVSGKTDTFVVAKESEEEWCSSVDVRVHMQAITVNSNEFRLTNSSKKEVAERTSAW